MQNIKSEYPGVVVKIFSPGTGLSCFYYSISQSISSTFQSISKFNTFMLQNGVQPNRDMFVSSLRRDCSEYITTVFDVPNVCGDYCTTDQERVNYYFNTSPHILPIILRESSYDPSIVYQRFGSVFDNVDLGRYIIILCDNGKLDVIYDFIEENAIYENQNIERDKFKDHINKLYNEVDDTFNEYRNYMTKVIELNPDSKTDLYNFYVNSIRSSNNGITNKENPETILKNMIPKGYEIFSGYIRAYITKRLEFIKEVNDKYLDKKQPTYDRYRFDYLQNVAIGEVYDLLSKSINVNTLKYFTPEEIKQTLTQDTRDVYLHTEGKKMITDESLKKYPLNIGLFTLDRGIKIPVYDTMTKSIDNLKNIISGRYPKDAGFDDIVSLTPYLFGIGLIVIQETSKGIVVYGGKFDIEKKNYIVLVNNGAHFDSVGIHEGESIRTLFPHDHSFIKYLNTI